MNNPKQVFILFCIICPFVCLFLPAYGRENEIILIEGIYSFEHVYIYAWFPAMILILLGILDFYRFSEGKTLLKSRLIAWLLVLCIIHQCVDMLIWNYRFFLAPQIAPMLILSFLIGRLIIQIRKPNVSE